MAEAGRAKRARNLCRDRRGQLRGQTQKDTALRKLHTRAPKEAGDGKRIKEGTTQSQHTKVSQSQNRSKLVAKATGKREGIHGGTMKTYGGKEY